MGKKMKLVSSTNLGQLFIEVLKPFCFSIEIHFTTSNACDEAIRLVPWLANKTREENIIKFTKENGKAIIYAAKTLGNNSLKIEGSTPNDIKSWVELGANM